MDVRINQPDEPGRERILPGVQWIEEVVFGGSFEGQCGLRRGPPGGKARDTTWLALSPQQAAPPPWGSSDALTGTARIIRTPHSSRPSFSDERPRGSVR